MPHEKINHGPNRNSLRVIWDEDPYPAGVFIMTSAASGMNPSWTMSRDGRITVALDAVDIDKLIAALRRARRKVYRQDAQQNSEGCK